MQPRRTRRDPEAEKRLGRGYYVEETDRIHFYASNAQGVKEECRGEAWRWVSEEPDAAE